MSETNADDLAKQERKRKEQELKKTVEQSSPSPHPTSVAGIVDAGQQTGATKKAEIEPEHESDVRVITRAIYREDNEGYADPKHPRHIWIVAALRNADEKVQPKQLTFGRFDEGNVVWSNDTTQIYFTSLRVDEPYYELSRTELYSVPANGGSQTKLNSIDMEMKNL